LDLLGGDDVDPIDLEEAVRVSREEGDVDPVEALERAKAARKERERAKEAEKLLVTKRRAASIEYSADEVDDTEFESYHQTIRRDSITRGQLNLLVRRLGYNASKIKHLSKKAASRVARQKNHIRIGLRTRRRWAICITSAGRLSARSIMETS
jgi:hypothetical protein